MATKLTEQDWRVLMILSPYQITSISSHMLAHHARLRTSSPSETAALAASTAREKAKDAEIEGLTKALGFYRDAFRFMPRRSRTGIDLSTWGPKKELLDDCGEIARAALSGRKPDKEGT